MDQRIGNDPSRHLTRTQKGIILYMSILDMSKLNSDIPRGTLDLLVLKCLDTMGPLHGYAIARRIEQVAGDSMQLSQGSIYPALVRLGQEGWIAAEWGLSETNRKVKFYSLTKSGRKQLRVEVANWEKATALVARFLEASR
jgi:PadR family transcriptional regulator, regulatory protein PadR